DPLSQRERARAGALWASRPPDSAERRFRHPDSVGDLGQVGQVGEAGRPEYPSGPDQLPPTVHRPPSTVYGRPFTVLLAPCILHMFDGVNEGARDVAAFS